MNKFTLLILGILIVFLNCDGRDRINKTPQEVLIENQLLDSFSENIKYFPKAYTETTTDTILSNGYRVTIKNYSDMKNSVLKTFETDSIKNKHYFRENISEVEVFKDDKQIFKQIINDDFLSLKETNTVHLVASLCIPRTANCPIYDITIDEKGMHKIKKQS